MTGRRDRCLNYAAGFVLLAAIAALFTAIVSLT